MTPSPFARFSRVVLAAVTLHAGSLALAAQRGEAPLRSQSAGGGFALPSFSRDGRVIAFSGGGEIYLMDADGTNQRQIPLPAGPKQSVALSPDATRLLYRTFIGRPADLASLVTTLVLVRADGADPRVVVTAGQASIGEWSPDGHHISFVTSATGVPAVGTSFVANADGTGTREIASGVPLAAAPRWSPDGRHILFPAPSTNGTAILIAEAAGAHRRQLTTMVRHQSAPAWGPDGRQLLFVGSDEGAGSSVNRMNVDGTDLRPVLQGTGRVSHVRFSPDGRRVLFQREREARRDVDVCIIDVEGTNERCLTPEVELDEVPSWSPDGTRILFQSNRDGPTGIFLMNADGTQRAQVALSMPRSDFVRLLAVSGVVWTLVALLSAGQIMVSRAFTGGVSPTAGTLSADGVRMLRTLPWGIAAACYFWWLVTPLVFLLIRRFPFAPGGRVKAAIVHGVAALGLSVLPSVVVLFVRWGSDLPASQFAGRTLNTLNLRFGLDVVTYIAVGAVAISIEQFNRGRAQALAASQLQTELAEARLNALAVQLHPHFLFNALNAVAMLIRRGASSQALQAVVGYGELLRSLLQRERADVLLRDELAFIRRYLEIEQMRFPDTFSITITADRDAEEALVPQLVLQPVVENALRHGFATLQDDATLSVSASRDDQTVRIEIRDNGAGLRAGWSLDEAAGVGLRNVRQRLAHRFGTTQRLELFTPATGGTTVVIEIPLQRGVAQTA